jgi:glycosyltransferase involved in cell wall biosynthesis
MRASTAGGPATLPSIMPLPSKPQGRTVPAGIRGCVCMIAYTNYATDARVRREAETLVSHGFRVRCLALKTGARPANTVLNGVEVLELGVRKYRGKSALAYIGSYVRFTLAASVACLRLLARRELDVLHVHNIPDFLVLAGVLPRLAGTKVILDVHDSVPETFSAKFSGGSAVWNALCLEESLSALVAHKVICVNHPQRDTLVARGIPLCKTLVSMNIADPSIFTPSFGSARSKSSAGSFNLVYHGTMAERLGVDLIIRATAQLRGRVPNLRLHLWGQGDDLPRFQQLAKELGVEDAVFFKPEGCPLQELPSRLSSMDLGVVGNRRGAACDLMLPVKLLEYVSLGIPAVAPRLKAIKHYFSDDMVGFYEPEDVPSLADAIERLYSEPATGRMQAGRAQGFLGEYGWDRQGTELVNLYQTLLEN